ncbi:MAG TPA: sigma factor, partial [Gammaproteobacteria bacterium]
MIDSRRTLFAKLVEPHFDALYRTAMRLTRNAADAEDLVQEVCLRAYAQLPSLERADWPGAWLQRVQYRISSTASGTAGARRLLRSPITPTCSLQMRALLRVRAAGRRLGDEGGVRRSRAR